MLNISSELLLCIFFILILSLFVLIKIADYIKKINLNNTVIEKHIIKESSNIINNDNINKKVKDKEKNNEVLDLDSKWSKPKDVESNMKGLGEEKVVDGSKSLDAVQLMRKFSKKNKGESG